MRCAAVAALMLACASAAAQSDGAIYNAVEAHLSERNLFTGEQLYRAGQATFFQAYVTGVYDAGSMTDPSVRLYCMPTGVSNGQMGDVVFRYLDANPAIRHLGAAHLVRRAFRDAWPCPAQVARPASPPSTRPAL